MNLPGQPSPDNTLPGYDLSRSLGNQTGADIDFKKLAEQLDCMRNFYNVGIIFDDGRQRWLVRPSRRIADANQSTVSHVVISKVPDIKQHSAEKAVVAALLWCDDRNVGHGVWCRCGSTNDCGRIRGNSCN